MNIYMSGYFFSLSFKKYNKLCPREHNSGGMDNV